MRLKCYDPPAKSQAFRSCNWLQSWKFRSGNTFHDGDAQLHEQEGLSSLAAAGNQHLVSAPEDALDSLYLYSACFNADISIYAGTKWNGSFNQKLPEIYFFAFKTVNATHVFLSFPASFNSFLEHSFILALPDAAGSDYPAILILFCASNQQQDLIIRPHFDGACKHGCRNQGVNGGLSFLNAVGSEGKEIHKMPSVQFRADAAHREDHISSVLIHGIQSDERVIVVKADVFKIPQAPEHGPGFHIMPVNHQGIGPADLVDNQVFVMDAFGSAHRAHASTAGVTKFVKETAVGYLMQKEIQYLGNAVEEPVRPFVAILEIFEVTGFADVLTIE